MDPHEVLQESIDQLLHASQFTGICNRVHEALKHSHISRLPLFTEIMDDVLDADKDYCCTMVLWPPCNIANDSSVPVTTSTPTPALPSVSSTTSVPIPNWHTAHSSIWTNQSLCHAPIFWLHEPMGIQYANQEVAQRR